MKVKEVFKTLAVRAGIPETDANLVATLNLLPDTEVDAESIEKPLLQNLITESEAENRPKIKGKFTAEALNGVDALIDKELGEFFSPEEIEGFKKDSKPTMKKIGQLLTKAKELKASGASPTEANNTIRQLNEQVNKLTQDKDSEISTLKQTHQRERFFDKLAAKVIGRPDVTDQAKAKDGRRVLTDFEDTLEAAGGVLDIATGKIMTKADPSLELFINSKPVTVDSVMAQTLTDNGWLKKSDPVQTTVVSVEQKDQQQGVSTSVTKNLANAKAAAKAE